MDNFLPEFRNVPTSFVLVVLISWASKYGFLWCDDDTYIAESSRNVTASIKRLYPIIK